MKKDVFLKGMAMMQAAYSMRLDDDTIDVYWQFLKEYHDKDFGKMVTQVIKTKKYFPKISELREELCVYDELRRGTTAAEEWDKIIKAAEDGKDCPDISEMARLGLQAAGGYHAVSFMQTEKLPFAFNTFKKTYEGQKERDHTIAIHHDPHPQLDSSVKQITDKMSL